MNLPALSAGEVAEAVDMFKSLLRFETVNPPGNERPCIDWIAAQLRREGIEPTILEAAPGRANLVARLKGGGNPALILTGHVDVVAVERDQWSVDPFGGIEKDGWIFGRGAVDMKHHVAMSLAVFLNLKRRGIALNRDVVLVCVADEEAGCTYGMKWLVEQHGDLLRAGYGLNEFGGFSVYLPNGKPAYIVQIAERGYCWFKMRARGLPGHGSLPPLDSAVHKLAAAVHRLGNSRLPHHLSADARIYIDALARAMGPAGVAIKLLKSAATENLALRLVPDKETRHTIIAALHNTAVPTVLRAGEKTNLLPSVAEVEVDGRYLPGLTEEQFLREVRDVVGDEVDIEVMSSAPPSSVTPDSPLYRDIEATLKARSDGAPVLPWMLIGFSDTKWLAQLGVKTYGFSPIRFPPDVKFAQLPHGHDERAPRDGFEWGVETLWQAVQRFATVTEG